MYDLSLESCSHVTSPGYDKQQKRIQNLHNSKKKNTAKSLLSPGLLYLTPVQYRRNEAVSVVEGLFFEHVSWRLSTPPKTI